ncbi:tyrosine-type recombinase/integrase [uncultured Algimonas sp.]|uniref:tyrosine-type recombinase/integrase n=1 Tax=uncultured Algimonas sp. TaxID=1547920 RepID=UPI00344E304B
MATFVQKGGKRQAQVALRVNGKSIRKAKSFRNKREAQVWAREFKAGITGGTDSSDTMRQVCERSAGKKGARWEVIRLDRFARDEINGKPLGDFVISQITTTDLIAWRDMRRGKVADSSVNRELNLLRNVFRVAWKEWQLIQSSPMDDVKKFADPPARDRRVLPDEIDTISGLLDLDREPWVSKKQITGAVFLFAIETAIRSSEILRMRNRDIQDNVVHLPDSKNSKPRFVPLTARAREIVAKVRGDRTAPNDHPFLISDADRDSVFRTARDASGIENLVFHDSRHEGITRLARVFVNPLDLQRVTGHKNLNQLLVYYETSPQELAERLNSATSKDEMR